MPILLCWALGAFKDSVTNATAVLVLVLFVVAVAAMGDRLAGLMAALSSAAAFDFYLTEPYQRFDIYDPNDVEAAVLLVLVGVGVTELALWGRRQQGRASRRAGYLEGVHQTAEIIGDRQSTPEQIIHRVAEQIRQVLDLDRCHFVPDTQPSPQAPRIDHDGSLSRGGQTLNIEQDGLPTHEEIGLIVSAAGVTRGHYLLTAATRTRRPTLEQRKVAVLLADQVGAFLADHGSPTDAPPREDTRSPSP